MGSYKGCVKVILGIYWGYIGIMEKNMETTIVVYLGMMGLYWGTYWDNGKQNGNYYLGFKGLGLTVERFRV